MKVLFLKGLPGSGKSTFARAKYIKDKNWVIVNRDSLRNMRGEYWIPKQEKMITEWEKMLIVGALLHSKNVIVDATNLNKNHVQDLKDYIAHMPQVGISVNYEYKFFNTSLEECIKRDLIRPNSVGRDVIMKMYNRYLAPDPVEYKENIGLPRCIICDIDGTIAMNTSGRSPYDWNRVMEDTPNRRIISLLYILNATRKIILFSGRDKICFNDTLDWLQKYGIPWDKLYMREENNNEKDTVIKRRMLEEHIRGKYYVDFVLDDRNQVVEMWRNELGLTCLQVAPGDF